MIMTPELKVAWLQSSMFLARAEKNDKYKSYNGKLVENGLKGEKMNSGWAVQGSIRDGVHAFSNRALKITWEAPMTLHAASSIL